VPRRIYEALLFFETHRRRPVAELSAAAISHFHEDDFVVVCHHEIDFTTARAVVARNRT
jgi:hypothetical protein